MVCCQLFCMMAHGLAHTCAFVLVSCDNVLVSHAFEPFPQTQSPVHRVQHLWAVGVISRREHCNDPLLALAFHLVTLRDRAASWTLCIAHHQNFGS